MTNEKKQPMDAPSSSASTTIPPSPPRRQINIEKDTELIEEKSLLSSHDMLEKEHDDGNIEYKWKLVGLSEDRFKHLVTQMKYRLSEGQGEAIYEIGINDDGYPLGLSEEEYRETLSNIEKMAAELQANVSIICEKQVTSEKDQKKSKKGSNEKNGSSGDAQTAEKRWVAEVLVRRFGEEEYLNVNIVVCGNVDSGKSTLIGVLTRGQLDNGRGLARSNVFIHKHELTTGRTSSISHQIMGFDAKGDIVNHSNLDHPTWKDIIEKSSKVCTFVDLAGHEKYLKTTVFGMTAGAPDYAVVCVGANMGGMYNIMITSCSMNLA